MRTWLGSILRALPAAASLAACLALAAPPAAGAAAPQKAKEKAPVLAAFAGTLKQARERATERNVPIVAIALLDEESDNEAARKELLASEEIARLSASCVLFFSNVGRHAPREVVETDAAGAKKKRTVCSAFATATCQEHQQHWDDIYNEYSENGVLRCPQVLVVLPDGKLAGRVSPGLKPEVSAIVELAAETQAKLGRGLDDAALAQVKDATGRAARAESAGKHGTAWRAFGEILMIAPDGPRAAVAKEGQKRAVEALAKQRDAAAAKLAEGDGLAGWLALEALAKDWTPSEQANELTRLMKRAEKEPALRDALAKKKRDDEAQALWDEAEAASRARQPKEAERKLRLLLKKYPGTPAYERAAKAHPEWVGG